MEDSLELFLTIIFAGLVLIAIAKGSRNFLVFITGLLIGLAVIIGTIFATIIFFEWFFNSYKYSEFVATLIAASAGIITLGLFSGALYDDEPAYYESFRIRDGVCATLLLGALLATFLLIGYCLYMFLI